MQFLKVLATHSNGLLYIVWGPPTYYIYSTIFLFIADTKEKCQLDLTNFLGMCQFLGVPIAEEKTVGPDTSLQFAGITVDSVLQEARLPEDKLRKCHTLNLVFITSEGDS